MNPSSILREIWRDIRTGTTRTLLLAGALGVLSTGLTVANGTLSIDLVNRAQEFASSGAAVATVTAPGRINGQACEALNAVPGIDASGAVRAREDQLTLALLPQSPLALYDTTESFPRVMNSAPLTDEGGVHFSDDVLRAIGSDGTDRIATSSGAATVAGEYSYPADGRRTGFGWAALVPETTSHALFDECWLRAWPQVEDAKKLLLTSVTPGDGKSDSSGIEVGQLNTRFGESFDGATLYQNRITAWAPLTGALLAAGLAAAAIRRRRLELAARLHDGATLADVTIISLGESLSWSIPASFASALAGIVVTSGVEVEDRATLYAATAMISVAVLLGATLGTLLAAATLKERHLFVFFKDRQ